MTNKRLITDAEWRPEDNSTALVDPGPARFETGIMDLD